MTYDVSRPAREIIWSWTEWQTMTGPPQISGISRSLGIVLSPAPAPSLTVVTVHQMTISVIHYIWCNIISGKLYWISVGRNQQFQGWHTDKKVWDWNRGRAKVNVLTEISLIFLSQTYTFNASSSLKKNCNKFMYWIHGQKIACTFMREPLQRFIFIWNNYERGIAKICFYMK